MMTKKEYAEKLNGQDIPVSDPIVVIDYSVYKFWYGWTAQRSYQDERRADISQMGFPLELQAREQIGKWKKEDNRKEVCDPMRSYENMPDYA